MRLSIIIPLFNKINSYRIDSNRFKPIRDEHKRSMDFSLQKIESKLEKISKRYISQVEERHPN